MENVSVQIHVNVKKDGMVRSVNKVSFLRDCMTATKWNIIVYTQPCVLYHVKMVAIVLNQTFVRVHLDGKEIDVEQVYNYNYACIY